MGPLLMPLPELPVLASEFPMLNRAYYAMDPAEYFRVRLQALALIVSPDVDHTEAFASGLTIGAFEISGSWSHDETAARRYLALESTILLHHAGEALLRQYLAHAFSEPCPWLKLSSITSPREFKKAVAGLCDELDSQERQRDIQAVFLGASDHEKFKDLSLDLFERETRSRVELLRFVAEEFLENANAYNAAKHGMAMDAGQYKVSLGRADDNSGDPPLIEQDGPALHYLRRQGGRDDRHWAKTRQFVNPERNVGLVFVIAEQLSALWRAARFHRRIDRGGFAPTPLDPDSLDGLLHAGAKMGMNVSTMDIRLWAEEPEKSGPTAPTGGAAFRLKPST